MFNVLFFENKLTKYSKIIFSLIAFWWNENIFEIIQALASGCCLHSKEQDGRLFV